MPSSMFETGGNGRIGDVHNGRAAQRDQGMVRSIAEICMDRSTSIRESGHRRGMARTSIRKHLRSI